MNTLLTFTATESTDSGVSSHSATDHEGDYTLVHETLKQLLSQTPIAIGTEIHKGNFSDVPVCLDIREHIDATALMICHKH